MCVSLSALLLPFGDRKARWAHSWVLSQKHIYTKLLRLLHARRMNIKIRDKRLREVWNKSAKKGIGWGVKIEGDKKNTKTWKWRSKKILYRWEQRRRKVKSVEGPWVLFFTRLHLFASSLSSSLHSKSVNIAGYWRRARTARAFNFSSFSSCSYFLLPVILCLFFFPSLRVSFGIKVSRPSRFSDVGQGIYLELYFWVTTLGRILAPRLRLQFIVSSRCIALENFDVRIKLRSTILYATNKKYERPEHAPGAVLLVDQKRKRMEDIGG